MIILHAQRQWVPWASVIGVLNAYFSTRAQAGAIPLPVEVTAIRDDDGIQLFSFLIDKNGTPNQNVQVQPPQSPLTVAITDGEKTELLRMRL